MARRPRIREPVAQILDDIADEHEYSTLDEAMSHVLREADYDL